MNRLFVSALAATALFLSTPVRALNPTVPQGGLPSATDFSAQILPERDGVVSWKTLAEVEPVKKGNKILPEFAKPILALDAKDQRVQGFMIPLDMGDKQRRFLLSAVPPHCSFCLPAGPEAVVEIVAKTPVAYTLEPIVVSGRFAVLKDDPNGVLYRLTDAAQVDLAKLAPTAPPSLVRRPAP
ncbi:MAG: hypothetical protein U1F51_08570 [Burkholderiales bacterium]